MVFRPLVKKNPWKSTEAHAQKQGVVRPGLVATLGGFDYVSMIMRSSSTCSVQKNAGQRWVLPGHQLPVDCTCGIRKPYRQQSGQKSMRER
jgi:hypothetical protein